jgi:hypothetical protein
MPVLVDRESLKISVTLSLFIRYSENLHFIYRTNLFAHSIHNSAVYIPTTCFGNYIAIITEYNTPIYLKQVKITYNFFSRGSTARSGSGRPH